MIARCVHWESRGCTAMANGFAGYGISPKAFFWIGIRDAAQTGSHIAFAAPDRATVDRFYAEAIAAGGRDNGQPGLRPTLSSGLLWRVRARPRWPQYRSGLPLTEAITRHASKREIENPNWPLRAPAAVKSAFNYWPGFVDALSTLVLSIVFLLSVFLVVQFFLSQEVTGKDKALEQLNAKIAQLNDLLSLEKLGKISLDDQVTQLKAGLASAETERDRVKGLYEGLAGANDAAGRANELNKALDSEKDVSARALAQIEVLTQQISALRRQLAALEEALDASEKRDKESQGRIADLGQRLNVALAQRVQELSRYRSEFFGRLRAILGNRPDIRIVGDRFVFQSEVFFDTGQAQLLPEGRAELDKLASALIDLDKQIPSEIAWVLRVDGHTDVRPINSPIFKSNWELSVGARDLGGAISGVARRAAAAAGRGRLRRIPAARHRADRRGLQAQSPHRIEADGTVVLLSSLRTQGPIRRVPSFER